jgi:hypothetical protein
MRLSAESLTSRIQNIRISYVLEWQADAGSQALRSYRAPLLKELEGRLAIATEPAQRQSLTDRIAKARARTARFACELIYAFPSIRFERAALESDGSDGVVPKSEIFATSNRKFTAVDMRTQSAAVSSQVSNNQLRSFTLLPTTSIGLRSYPVEGPFSQSLDSLLSEPQATYLEGRESLRSIDTIVLRVGPGIPKAHRPDGYGDDDYVKLWLAPRMSHLAIKREYHTKSPRPASRGADTPVRSVELADFRPVPDVAGLGADVYLPFSITRRGAFGSWTCTISSIKVNGGVIPSEFQPSFPPGFGVSVDGGKQYVLVGGPSAKRQHITKSLDSARRLLRTSPARATSPALETYPIVIGIGCTVCFGALYLLRRRRQHAS